MKIIYKTQSERNLSLKNVQDNQFFVDFHGSLCQKMSEDKYNIVAHSNGSLFSDRMTNCSPNTPIKRILSEIERIEF